MATFKVELVIDSEWLAIIRDLWASKEDEDEVFEITEVTEL
jgi:hypothetical protein